MPWLRRLGNPETIYLSASLILTGILIALAGRSLQAMIVSMTVIGSGISVIYPAILGIAADRFSGETGTTFGAIIASGGLPTLLWRATLSVIAAARVMDSSGLRILIAIVQAKTRSRDRKRTHKESYVERCVVSAGSLRQVF